jgi:asparagine synthase (glutamine-hydrolysing)
MCGITGIVATEGVVSPPVLQRMTDLLAHRGPDGAGFMVAAGSWGHLHHSFRDRAGTSLTDTIRVALGHRRLAILDLSDRGLQPMGIPDGRTWVVFNGEIYNYRELRSSLQSRGHVFRTRTDTEVVLRAYMEWGEACLAQFDGMFAFAVWDDTRARLFCARDRLGIKPFYYATPPGLFVFASEIKSLLAHPDCRREVDDVAAAGFLVHSNCDYAERTLFRGIRSLPAAHSLTLDASTGRIVTRPYWRLAPAPPCDDGCEDRVAAVREALIAAVRTHLVSDVRIGSCLSGGLDSSTLVGIIGKLSSEDPSSASAVGDRLYTFTSCFDDRAFDEREYALAVANSVGAQAHLVFPSPSDFWSEFERMAWYQDMPFGVLSFYAQWRVMRAAREAGVKVLIDGQGGDEVFGGYAKFRYAYLASLLRASRLTAVTRELVGMVRRRDGYFFDLRRGYRYLPRYMRRALKVDSLLQRVLRRDWHQTVADESTPATRWWRYAREANNRQSTLLQRVQVDDITIDTLPQLLRMEDRSSMAFSIEARVPLLDHRVVELGLSLPDHLKVHDGWSKYAVRRAMAGLLPERVRLRTTKLGFAAPDRTWLTGDLRGPITELLESDLRSSRFLDVPSLRRWYRSPASGRANTESLLGLFRVLSLEMWMRAFSLS